jgi:hypothetical protein
MTQAPSAPEPFFTEYVPSRVAELSALAGRNSAGSVAFDVIGAGTWWLRLKQGTLEVSTSELPDHLLTVALRVDDFTQVIVAGVDRLGQSLPPERQMMAARLLTLDDERAKLVSSVPGSLGLALSDGPLVRRLLVAPRAVKPSLDQPTCEIACSIEDFWAMQSGAVNPFELLMNGRIKLDGDAQVAVALSGIFG